MLPWIIAEFVGLAFITVVIVLGIIILCVYPPNDLDVGALVAIGVIVAAAMGENGFFKKRQSESESSSF